MNSTESHSPIEIHIRPTTGWFHIDWEGLKQYRDLLWLMIQRDFTSKYKQTILGPLWFFLSPLISTLVFVLVFNKVIGVQTEGVPATLFYMAGMIGWTYFSTVLGSTANSLAGNTHLFAKVYFPRLIPPLTATISCLFALAIQLITFAAFYVQHTLTAERVQVAPPSLSWLLLPFIILHMAVLALGVGLLLSALSAKYRDIQQVQGFFVNIWFYATPILYPLSKIPESKRWLAEINPVTSIVEAVRHLLLGVGTVTLSGYTTSVTISVIVFAVGLFSYQKSARSFVDTV